MTFQVELKPEWCVGARHGEASQAVEEPEAKAQSGTNLAYCRARKKANVARTLRAG